MNGEETGEGEHPETRLESMKSNVRLVYQDDDWRRRPVKGSDWRKINY